MAQCWTAQTARALIQKWTRQRIEAAVRAKGLTVDLGALEAWIIDQKPSTLAEAERLLELILTFEGGASQDLSQLCRVGGAVRNDIGRNGSRVELSFAPQASGPIAGRA